MVANDIGICDKMTSNGYMSIEKDITKCEKRRFKLSIHLNEPKKQFSKEIITNLVGVIINSSKQTQEVVFFQESLKN